eukprot:gene18085-21612_t
MKTASNWLWTRKSNNILAVEVDNRVYNVKDVESISREQKELIVVRLTNGEQLKTHPERFRWLSCDTSKACPNSARILTSNYNLDLKGALNTIEMAQLQNPDTIKLGRSNIPDNPRTAIIDDYRAIPYFYSVGDRVDALKDAEFTNLNVRIAAVLEGWDANAPERKAREKRELDEIKDATKRRFDQLRNAGIGTPAYCEREIQGDLPKHVALSCPNHGGRFFSISDFEEAGWNVVSINTTPTLSADTKLWCRVVIERETETLSELAAENNATWEQVLAETHGNAR